MLSGASKTTLHQVFPKEFFSCVGDTLGQYCTDKNPVECSPRDSKQHCTSKMTMQCCCRGSRQQCIGKRPVKSCLKILWTTMHRSKVYVMLSEKKLLYNVFLILLGQHWTVQNPKQCCLRGSRQHCIRKNPVHSCLNTLGTTLHRSKPYAMLSEMLQTTLHKKKSYLKLS